MTYTTHSYTSERGNHITVRRPELTEEERAKRMEAIKQAAIRLVIATEKNKIHKQKERKELTA